MFQKGFSMIELLVIVLIIGLLAAVSIASFSSPTKTVKAKEVLTNVESAGHEMMAWAAQKNNDVDFDESFSPLASSDTELLNKAKEVAPAFNWVTWPGDSPGNEPVWTQKDKKIAIKNKCYQNYSTGSLGTMTSNCFSIIACVKYFSDSKNLCFAKEVFYERQTIPTQVIYAQGPTVKNIYNAANPATLGTSETQAKYTSGWPMLPNKN